MTAESFENRNKYDTRVSVIENPSLDLWKILITSEWNGLEMPAWRSSKENSFFYGTHMLKMKIRFCISENHRVFLEIHPQIP